MPVTAKLSREFYERLGENLANELVEWFNAVDATYRADLRELNELNFQRFDAKLEQRLAQMDAKWERRLAEMDAKWEGRLTRIEATWEGRLARIEATWEARLAQMDAKWERRTGELRAELIKWMFAFWTGTVVPLGGLIVALHLL